MAGGGSKAFRAKVEGFVPRTEHVNLEIVKRWGFRGQDKAAVERIRHTRDSQGQILALAFR